MRNRTWVWSVVFMVASRALLLGQPTAPKNSKSILIDGSSTVAPITQAVAAEFVRVHPDAKVSVGVSGTSGGFRRWLALETDINDASRPIKEAEIRKAEEKGIRYVEILVGFDGLTVAVSRNTRIFKDEVPCMTVGELEFLWSREAEGRITRWNQLGSRFADAPIKLSGAAETSGTFDFFTGVINGREGDIRADYFGTEEDQLLAEQVSKDPYALTFFGFAYYLNNQEIVQPVAIDPRRQLVDAPKEVLEEINRLRAENGKAPLQNGAGSCQGIFPSVDAIASYAYQPLTRPLFIYVNLQSAERPMVDAFVDFYLKKIEDLEFMLDVGYVPAAQELLEAARSCWDHRIHGTAFGGAIELSGEEVIDRYLNHSQP